MLSCCFKYFIRPNKRRRIRRRKGRRKRSRMNSSTAHLLYNNNSISIYISSLIITILCLNQIVCIQNRSSSSTSNNQQLPLVPLKLRLARSELPITEPTNVSTIVRFANQSARLECSLTPPPLPPPLVGVARRSTQGGAVIDGGPAGDHLRRRQVSNGGGGSEFQRRFEEETAEEDLVQLILWYHSSQSSTKPIYSLDARLNQQQQQTHYLSSDQSPADGFVPVPVAQLSRQQQHRNANSIRQSALVGLDYLQNVATSPSSVTQPQHSQVVANVISGQAKHFVASRLSSRIHLTISAEEAKAYLIINKLEANDAGQYKCRVDFRYARTRYQLSQLDVVTPVRQLQINATKTNHNKKGTAGSQVDVEKVVNNHQWPLMELSEDETLHLECKAKDGWPNAKLAWWRIQWPKQQQQPQQLKVADQPLSKVVYPTSTNRLLTEAQVTQLSQSSSSVVKVDLVVSNDAQTADSLYRPMHERQPPASFNNHQQQPLVDLINELANTMPSTAAVAAAMVKQTNNTAHVPSLKQTRLSSSFKADKLPLPGDANYIDETNEHRQWLNWMTGELEEALSGSGAKGISSSDAAAAAAATTKQKSSLAKQLAASLNGSHQLESWRNLQSRLLYLNSGQSNSGQQWSGDSQSLTLEMLQFARQNQLQLYTCGASNTRYYDNNKLLMSTLNSTSNSNKSEINKQQDERHFNANQHLSEEEEEEEGDDERAVNSLRDKLASIRPVFTSVLVQPIVRPRAIHMFLVGSRRAGNSAAATGTLTADQNLDSREEHLEFTPLTNGQDLHLNLATDRLSSASSSSSSADVKPPANGERQLQFLCLASGSLPAAKVEWFRHEPQLAAYDPNNSQTIATQTNAHRRQSTYLPLASENPSVTQSLLRALTSPSLNLARWLHNNSILDDLSILRNKQWSSLRLHNIGIDDHETLIKCSAFNEKLYSSGDDDDDFTVSASDEGRYLRTPGKLSTYIRLNITHVPLVKLELDSRNVTSSQDSLSSDTTILEALPDLSSNNDNNHYYYHHRNNFNHQQRQIKPIISGTNVTLLCNVSFVNPPLSQPIEWSVISINTTTTSVSKSATTTKADNGYTAKGNLRFDGNTVAHADVDDNINREEPLDKAIHLIRVLSKIQTSNRYNLVEKLIVQLSEKSKLLHEIQLNCRARNTLGQATSNIVSLVSGQLPHCQGDKHYHNDNNPNQEDETYSNDNNSNIEGIVDMMTDNEPSFAYCPVISDKASTTYHWLVEPSQETTMSSSATIPLSSFNLPLATTTTSVGGEVIKHINTTKSSAIGEMIKRADKSAFLVPLALVVSSSKDKTTLDEKDNVGLKISCYASDKFGSNIMNPCSIRIGKGGGGGKEKKGVVGDANSRALHNCAANVVIALDKNQQEQLQQLIDSNNNSNTIITNKLATGLAIEQQAASPLLLPPHKPKLKLTVECKANQIARSSGGEPRNDYDDGRNTDHNDNNPDDAELIHLDLYQKRDTQFIKHLTSYPKEDGANVSLKLDLGQEFENLALSDIEEQHVIVMSVTDVNNRLKQPNITLYFNTTPSLTPHQHSLQTTTTTNSIISSSTNTKSSIGNLPRTNDSGHQDRLWVISSMSVVFMSSIMLVLLAWLCKSSHGSLGINAKTQGLDFNGNNTANSNNNHHHHQYQNQNHKELARNQYGDQQLSELQTEMYLVGEEPHLTVYHNTATIGNKPLLSSSRDNLWKSGASGGGVVTTTTAAAVTTTITNPYDFGIDQTKSQAAQTVRDTTTPSSAGTTTTLTNNTKQQAILLLDPEIHTCTAGCFNQGCGIQAEQDKCRSILAAAASCASDIEGVDDLYEEQEEQEQFHIEPFIRLHPVSLEADSAILRAAFYNEQDNTDTGNHLHLIDSIANYSLERTLRQASFRSSRPSSQQQVEFFELQPVLAAQKTRIIRTPTTDQFVKTTTTTATTTTSANSAPNGYNFELNSQGELTMTDESSSFIHDDGHGNNNNNNHLEQTTCMLICSQCRMDASHSTSASIHHQSVNATTAAAALMEADEFHQLESQQSTPIDNMLNAATLNSNCLQHSSLIQSPASYSLSSQSTNTARQEADQCNIAAVNATTTTTTSSSSSTLRRSTLSSSCNGSNGCNASGSKRNERVRFVVDHHVSNLSTNSSNSNISKNNRKHDY